jgi:hypothetical protein
MGDRKDFMWGYLISYYKQVYKIEVIKGRGNTNLFFELFSPQIKRKVLIKN